MCGGGSDASGEIEKQNLVRQQNIQRGMRNINTVFSGFTPDFYRGVRQNAMATLMPQLGRQFRQARNTAAFSLADRGLLKGSAARKTGTELALSRGLGESMVANQASEQENEMRRAVSMERTNLVNQLVASQDPTIAAQQAVSSVASLRAPSLVAPLGDFFQGITNAAMARQISRAVGPYERDTKALPTNRNYYRED